MSARVAGLVAASALAVACGNTERAAPEPVPRPAQLDVRSADASSPPSRPPPARDAAAVTAPELQPDELVDIHVVDDTIALDIRYATANNFTGVAVYPQARCKLRYAIARRLAAVQAAVRARGYRLEVWDCYRPFSVQKKLWELVPDPRYVAKPVSRRGKLVSGSKHNRGAAVDLTLIDSAGSELEMPTAYDEFSRKAHRNWRGASKRAREHSQLLEQAMVDQGFEPLPTEWWHFDGPGWADYPLSDEPL